MKKVIKAARKIVTIAIGLPIFVIGVILIPLPGPGLLVCLLALFILSFEFEWAGKYRDRSFAELKKIWQTAKERADKIAEKGDEDTLKK